MRKTAKGWGGMRRERAFKAIEDFQAQVQYAHIIQRYVQHSNGHDAHRHHHDAEHVQAQAYK
jgi:hypothetical protein